MTSLGTVVLVHFSLIYEHFTGVTWRVLLLFCLEMSNKSLMAFPGLLYCAELSIAKQRLHVADIPYEVKQELFGATSSLTFFFGGGGGHSVCLSCWQTESLSIIRTYSSVNHRWKVISVMDSKPSPNAKASIIEEHYSCC
jgi:hypothetical protein